MTAPATLFSSLAATEDTAFATERKVKPVDPTVLAFAEKVKAGTPQVLGRPTGDKEYRQVVAEFNRAAAQLDVKFSYAKGTNKSGTAVFRISLVQPATTDAKAETDAKVETK